MQKSKWLILYLTRYLFGQKRISLAFLSPPRMGMAYNQTKLEAMFADILIRRFRGEL